MWLVWVEVQILTNLKSREGEERGGPIESTLENLGPSQNYPIEGFKEWGPLIGPPIMPKDDVAQIAHVIFFWSEFLARQR